MFEIEDRIAEEVEVVKEPLDIDDLDDLEPKERWFHRTFPALKWVPSNPKLLKETEEKFLSYVKIKSTGSYVDVGTINGDSCRIWTRKFGAVAVTKDGPLPLVLIHGMGAGLALFCKNFEQLAAERPLYAIDLPGFARSSRPRFSSDYKEAELQFVTAIEEWRKKVGLDRMCLLGHSFGGYLSASYSLKYPERVGHLILADAWGFSERPTDLVQRRKLPWYLRGLFHVVKHFNPLATFRLTGPFGERMITRMRPDLIRKFESIFGDGEDHANAVPSYLFHCNSHEPTGESAFHSMMTGFAWAKDPMLPRLADLSPEVPITAIYGGLSWVSTIPKEVFQSVAKRPEDSYTHVAVLEDSSHHVYADESEEFNEEVLRACHFSDKKEKTLVK